MPWLSRWRGLSHEWSQCRPATNLYEPDLHRTTRPVLAYIHQYSIVNGCAPAEADMQRFFQITPPSVHSMVLTLERRGFEFGACWTGAQYDRGSLPDIQPRPSNHEKRNQKSCGWSAVRQQLATWEKPALLALVKDLYEAAAENRDFIHARCQAGESAAVWRSIGARSWSSSFPHEAMAN